MPFAGMINNDIADLQKEIFEFNKHHENKNMKEIFNHNAYSDCLTCHHRCLGEDETLYLPFGKYVWRKMAYHVLTYMQHLIIYRYLDTEITIFLNSIYDTNFFEYYNVQNVQWAFEFCDKKVVF